MFHHDMDRTWGRSLFAPSLPHPASANASSRQNSHPPGVRLPAKRRDGRPPQPNYLGQEFAFRHAIEAYEKLIDSTCAMRRV